jgi:hypothetical protein
MNAMRLMLAAGCASAMLWAGDGIHPRAASADYPVEARAGDVTVAAAIVPAAQARKIFGADLNRAGYVVVEIALFPDAGAGLQIAADDFMLRNAPPASARAVADVIDRKDNPSHGKPGGPQVYTAVTVGYETGSAGGPVYGRRHGVYTSTSVGVGNPPYPGPVHDPAALEHDLADKALPEGNTARAVAGYLYFPKPAGRNADYELTWYAAAGAVRMMVPAAK